MKSKLQKDNKGFTIIEVLIVLAIAGLILLIVFLAVPALQRNSRNTQRKNDVQNVLGAMTEYSNNNNGKLPADYAAIQDTVKPGFYVESGDIKIGAISDADNNRIIIVKAAKCVGDTPTTSGASSRNFIAIYSIETSGDLLAKCQQS